MPMLHVGRNINNIAGVQFYCWFAFFLIPSLTGNAYKELASAFACMMYVPVVAATGLKCYISEIYANVGNGVEIAVADKVFGVCRIRIADGEDTFLLEFGFGVVGCCDVFPYLGCLSECAPCFRPSRIECDLRENFGDFIACDTVFLSFLKMICKRTVDNAAAHKSCHGDNAAVAQRKLVGAAPYFAE